jgi:hypothetical protein
MSDSRFGHTGNIPRAAKHGQRRLRTMNAAIRRCGETDPPAPDERLARVERQKRFPIRQMAAPSVAVLSQSRRK